MNSIISHIELKAWPIVSDKSFLTNFISVLFILVGYALMPLPQAYFFSNIGYFALSGALTNWIAIYMLFERVPFLYGSGIIPLRFESFKLGIKNLVMGEFFGPQQLEALTRKLATTNIQWETLAEYIDYEKIYKTLSEGILDSTLGKMLMMFGGKETLEKLRFPIQQKLHQAVSEILLEPSFQTKISEKLIPKGSDFHKKIEALVNYRLSQLTPDMVKDIIQRMIKEHLGWLVVWGGVFGGLIGLIASLLK